MTIKYRRTDWLERGLDVLGHSGVDALTIDGMCQLLGVTKGSFYHHFQNRDVFLEALLDYWEAQYTTQFIAYSQVGQSPQERLSRLSQLVVETHNTSESSIRAWAKSSPMARAYLERVDQRRIGYLRELYQALGRSEAEAQVLANLFYAVLIGAQEVIPAFSAEALGAIYTLLGKAFRFVP